MVEHGQFWVLARGILEISKLKLYKKLARNHVPYIRTDRGDLYAPPPTYGHGGVKCLPSDVVEIN